MRRNLWELLQITILQKNFQKLRKLFLCAKNIKFEYIIFRKTQFNVSFQIHFLLEMRRNLWELLQITILQKNFQKLRKLFLCAKNIKFEYSIFRKTQFNVSFQIHFLLEMRRNLWELLQIKFI